MDKIKDEFYKSIRYIIPVLFTFLCALIFENFDNITNSLSSNIQTIINLLNPFFIGFIIAYIVNHPLKTLENKFDIKRGLCILIIYGSLVCIIIFACFFILPIIRSNINDIYTYIPQGIEHIQNFLDNLLLNIEFDINSPYIKNQINNFVSKVLLPISTVTANIMSDIVINATSIIVGYIVNIFLGLVISVYLLLSKEKSIHIINVLSKKLLKNKYLKVKEFVNVLDKNIGVYLIAKAMDSTIYGIICTVILSIVGSKYALLLGIVAGLTNMIPFFGPIIGTIIVVTVNLFFSLDKALIVLVVMIVVQQLESVILEPFFVGKQVGVPPIFTILAVTFASKYTGLIGILLSVPVAGVLLMYANKFLDKECE